ncbi:MAG: penicillin-binding protein 1C [Candidatus Hinthialibacter antarcticus]|nr:penicillin-binding protein 1C [Candidatus Hinthialibacter antarcticus]
MARLGQEIARTFYRAAAFESRRRRAVQGLCLFAISCLMWVFLWPMNVERFIAGDASGEMLDRNGALLYAFLTPQDEWRIERSLDQISPYLAQATIAVEDQRFGYHPGVDPISVLRAAWQNMTQRRVVSGASTLAMQVVKLGNRRQGRPNGKISQALLALRLQAHSKRDDILAAYLNWAPYGGNLVGCEAASRRYFGKPALELTVSEAALLAAIPKSPAVYSPFGNVKKARQRRNFVLHRMKEEGYLSEAEYQWYAAEPLGARNHSFPKRAPHLAMRMENELSQGETIQTTLDGDIQREVERTLQSVVRSTQGEITNAAAIVIDVSSAEILARAGSADFWDKRYDGQYDAARAARSPGSTLKPFVYALAMREHLLYPNETLFDGVWDQGRYHPENFDFEHRGLISASDALRDSLNIPAVTLLQRIGVAPAYEFMRTAGVTTFTRSPEHYGLSLVLGGCEARLDELASAYCMLASLGASRPLKVRVDSPTEPAQRLLPRGVCVKLYEMLEQPLPRELFGLMAKTVHAAPRVCFKTGTSPGRRDAWCFVFNQQYLVGVWMGNNDSRPSKKLVGAESALPLAAQLFRSLPIQSKPAWPDAAGDVRTVEVCALSGLPMTRWCPHTRSETFPREQYLNRLCDMHYPGEPGQIVEHWPGSPHGWDLASISSPVVPELAATRSDRREDLRILEPAAGAEYVFTGEDNGDRIRLRTSVDAQTNLDWYLNDRYLGRSAPQRPMLLSLTDGEHRLACMSADGIVQSVIFTVSVPTPAPR